MSVTMSLDQVEALSRDTLMKAGATRSNAESVARSTRFAERDGIRSHGLLYIPIYASHLKCGKVDGAARPIVSRPRPGIVCVDAATGFAHPAIDAGWDAFMEATSTNGVGVLAVHNSYNCGVLGHHAERIAQAGFLGICATHAPASIAAPGGRRPVIGTNPFAVGVPDGRGGSAFVIDQSASAIAKSEIMLRARQQRSIEPGWAVDREGRPTTDAEKALKGAMLPAGGHKGFGMGLMVELLASCLAGAVLSKDASPFSGPDGGPPRTGQCFIAIDPLSCSDRFSHQVDALIGAILNEEGTRLPGSRRIAARSRTSTEGVAVDPEFLAGLAQ